MIVLQAALLSRLDNPLIVQYLESGKSARADVYWIVTELLLGSALDDVLETEGPMSEADAIKVLFFLQSVGSHN